MLGAVVVPGTEDGVPGHDQLFVRILREVALGVLFDDFLVFLDDFLQGLGIQVGVELGFFLFLLGVEYVVKLFLLNIQNDVAEHLDEAAIGIGGEASIVAARGQRVDALVIEAEIEDRVHHARHGKLCARTHTYQQRILSDTQFLALQFLQVGERLFHLSVHVWGDGVAPHVFTASFGLNGEARRDRQARICHFGQTGAFAAQLVFHFAVAVGLAGAKEIYILD